MDEMYESCWQKISSDADLNQRPAEYLLGYYRRSLAETVIERIAPVHGIKVRRHCPRRGGTDHCRIWLGAFQLQVCHVSSPDGFPKGSLDRAEASKDNDDYISQMDMLKEVTPPADNSLFGVIIHSNLGAQKDVLGSIKIGFPNSDNTSWVEAPICLREVLDIHRMKANRTENPQETAHKDEVVWKKKPTKDKERKAG